MKQLVPIGTARPGGGDPAHLPGLDVLVVLYGHSQPRAVATSRTFARWHQYQHAMPRVLCAWCYRDGNEPDALARVPDYPWLERVRLPEYDLDDGVFRKEGLLQFLLREQSTAPYVLSLDSDPWSDDRMFFCKVRDTLAENPLHVLQPYRMMTDTREPQPLYSLASQTLPGGKAGHMSQPGLGWGFSREWADLHGAEPVFNPWMVTGSGDTAFVLEHLAPEEYLPRYRERVVYPYMRSILRDDLPRCVLACIPVDVRHENHTNRAAVPEPFRGRRYADRAYTWSRRVLDYIGGPRAHVYLDDRGVPMPINPDGPFVRIIRRKPEMQDRASTEAIIAEETGCHLRFVTAEQLADATTRWPDYYRNRTPYYDAAIAMIAGYPGMALEIGPFRCPLVRDDVVYLDRQNYGHVPLLKHDLDKGPMIFGDDTFAVSVALQVLEHLRDPSATIRDMLRVAPVAVVSIPWQWPAGGDPGHEGIGDAQWSAWLADGNARELCRQIVGSAPRRRLVATITRPETRP